MENLKGKLNKKVDIKIVYAVIAIVIVLAIFLARIITKKPATNETGLNENTSAIEQVDTTTKPAYKPTTKPVVTPAVKMSYTNAVAQYGSNRIQFGANCQATPASATYKNNTSVVLDNRSGAARSIDIDGTVYKIPAYDYAIATVYSNTLPKTVLVDCGNQQNVATILIQK
jgi:ABC-type cobalt transport system substrate-binding protein